MEPQKFGLKTPAYEKRKILGLQVHWMAEDFQAICITLGSVFIIIS